MPKNKRSSGESSASSKLVVPLYLRSVQDNSNERKFTNPDDEEDIFRRNIATIQLANRLDDADFLSLDEVDGSDISDGEIDKLIIDTVTTQLQEQYVDYRQWLGATKKELNETIHKLLKKFLEDSNDFPKVIKILAKALNQPTDDNIEDLKQNIQDILNDENIHGKENYPSLINCVCCLLNGERLRNNNPQSWDNKTLKDFIQQARVRLVNCRLIPHRFQWLSGGNSLEGNPEEIDDIKKPWAVYTRRGEEGMLITGHSGRIIAKVEKNKADTEMKKAELQSIFNYDKAALHSIIVDVHPFEDGKYSIGVGVGLLERSYRENTSNHWLKFS